jgi:aspartate ammonia-lyase
LGGTAVGNSINASPEYIKNIYRTGIRLQMPDRRSLEFSNILSAGCAELRKSESSPEDVCG